MTAGSRVHLEGDELADALVPIADQLVAAVHQLDGPRVAGLFATAAEIAGDELLAARLLAVLGAGGRNEDVSSHAALGWTRDPAAYHRYRRTCDAMTASMRAGRTTH